MTKKIEAKIVADSIDKKGIRITTFLLTYPRIIHSELMTHRVFSRNSASSRAIPFEKMVKMVEEDPFIPIAWQKDHKGMQGTEYLGIDKEAYAIEKWLQARDSAVHHAKQLHSDLCGVTKQLCNRILEPYMWHTVLVTATEYGNFFDLRCPKYKVKGLSVDCAYSKKEWRKLYQLSSAIQAEPETDIDWLKINTSQAEIHIQALAEAMWDAYMENKPKEVKPGDWHIPFGDDFDEVALEAMLPNIQPASLTWHENAITDLKVKIATARCARLSYMTFDGDIDYKKDLILYDRLFVSHHLSPFEHCAQAFNGADTKGFTGIMLDDATPISGNFIGYWKQYRQIIEQECQKK
mgnify:CR=1 FL=1